MVNEITSRTVLLIHAMRERVRQNAYPWGLRGCQRDAAFAESIESFKPDLLVSLIQSAEDLEHDRKLCKRLSIPLIAHGSNAAAERDRFSVCTDEFAYGREAGRHLASKGYSSLGLIGNLEHPLVQCRLDGLAAGAGVHSERIHCLQTQYSVALWLRTNPTLAMERALTAWLKELPKPVGIFCMSYIQACEVENLCFEMGLEVPRSIGILGVGNRVDENPYLREGISYIEVPIGDIGFDLADRADLFLRKGKVSEATVLGPAGISERGSTDISFAFDPVIAKAMRHIRDRFDQPLQIGEIARHVGLSRSGFEKKFKAVTGITPLNEIHRQRLNRAKHLLVESSDSLQQVAERCGIKDPYQFSTFFKKNTGITPREYRKRKGEGV